MNLSALQHADIWQRQWKMEGLCNSISEHKNRLSNGAGDSAGEIAALFHCISFGKGANLEKS